MGFKGYRNKKSSQNLFAGNFSSRTKHRFLGSGSQRVRVWERARVPPPCQARAFLPGQWNPRALRTNGSNIVLKNLTFLQTQVSLILSNPGAKVPFLLPPTLFKNRLMRRICMCLLCACEYSYSEAKCLFPLELALDHVTQVLGIKLRFSGNNNCS